MANLIVDTDKYEYRTIPTSFLYDNNLSLAAKGLLTCFYAKPWFELDTTALFDDVVMRELMENGYMIVYPNRIEVKKRPVLERE